MRQWYQKFNEDLTEDSGFLGYDAVFLVVTDLSQELAASFLRVQEMTFPYMSQLIIHDTVQQNK
jgi:hypothetical protein